MVQNPIGLESVAGVDADQMNTYASKNFEFEF